MGVESLVLVQLNEGVSVDDLTTFYLHPEEPIVGFEEDRAPFLGTCFSGGERRLVRN